jgi:hypothetical protein
MMHNQIDEFETLMRNLTGLLCWNIHAGAVGSLIGLHLGEKVPLKQPLPFPNTSLTPDEHKYRGEYILYVEDCPWRLESTDSVIALWTDSNAPDGPIIAGMQRLIGHKIEQLEVLRPGLDLVIRFTNGLTLRIFPDQADPDEGDNYALSLVDKTYVVAARSTLYIEET